MTLDHGLALYLDLDGTIVDVWQRHYQAYSDIVRSMGHVPIGFEEYRKRKRAGIRPGLHPDGPDVDRSEFMQQWRALIETREFVQRDTLIPGADDCLGGLAERSCLSLVTLRHNRRVLLWQLNHLGLSRYFVSILSPTEFAGSGADKVSLIRGVQTAGDHAVVVGDTEADVHAAKALVLPCFCVTSGLRNRGFLQALNPDRIIDSIADLPEALRDMASTVATRPLMKRR